MKNNGYTHYDLHCENIGAIIISQKILKIQSYDVLLFGYQYKAIDFRLILNKRYSLNLSET